MAEMNLSSSARPHRRFNPLRGQWILVSPQRTQRPWQGQVSKPADGAQLAFDPACYLCPGNARAGGATNPKYTDVYAFDNDYPALLPLEVADADASANADANADADADSSASLRNDKGEGLQNDKGDGLRCESASPQVGEADGLLISEAENGRCRVVCFHPNHSLTLSQMEHADIVRVVGAWKAETATLGALEEIRYVQIFENRGAMMGASNPHPHCQIWATGHVPDEPAAETLTQQAYLAQHGRTLLAAYLEQEVAAGERIVCANDEFVAVVPYWAVWPFETLVLPRTQIGSFVDFTSANAERLADILKRVTTRYDHLFATSFPYSMGFHQRPTDGEAHPEWTFHAHYYPPLLRSAEIRKFMVGFELLGMPQRDITPEKAAEMLRAQPEA